MCYGAPNIVYKNLFARGYEDDRDCNKQKPPRHSKACRDGVDVLVRTGGFVFPEQATAGRNK